MKNVVFLVPHPKLGRTEDVFPERIQGAGGGWVPWTREVLRKRRAMQAVGTRQPVYVGEEHEKVKPFTADHCPAMAEIDSVGFLLKWPATAVLRKVAPRGWQLKTSTSGPEQHYRYSPLTSIPEGGEAEAIEIDTGWLVVTPPDWSVLLKGLPNDLAGSPRGLTLAEGIVRTDRATVPLVTHALIGPGAGEEILLERGKPMAMLFPFRREEIELAVVDDPKLSDEVADLAQRAAEAYALAPGVYKRLYLEAGEPSPLWPRLLEWKKGKA